VLVGAALLAALGLLDLTLGLLAVAAGIGWAAGEMTRPAGAAVAAGVGSVLLGLTLRWGWSLVEGGVLGPVAYLAERYGIVALLLPVVAAAAAALRAR